MESVNELLKLFMRQAHRERLGGARSMETNTPIPERAPAGEASPEHARIAEVHDHDGV